MNHLTENGGTVAIKNSHSLSSSFDLVLNCDFSLCSVPKRCTMSDFCCNEQNFCLFCKGDKIVEVIAGLCLDLDFQARIKIKLKHDGTKTASRAQGTIYSTYFFSCAKRAPLTPINKEETQVALSDVHIIPVTVHFYFQVEIHLHEKTCVRGKFIVMKADSSHFAVDMLQTPIGVVNHAIIRVSDTITLKANLNGPTNERSL
ncbi:unnamed protein product [Enterobius vermicularis]|uniref:DUF4773 domain-containing protein n=1 Tax=Enterobius vermicularis TaxID=51028 RepID=A0A0N4UYX6_ENTVE|nr:unnamed protein product [Enterobius vermicularis]